MAIDYCAKHHTMFDRDEDAECPCCASEPKRQWVRGPFSHRLMHGDDCLAVIIPQIPRPWNGNTSFKITGKKIPLAMQVRSFEIARQLAEAVVDA